MTSIRQRILKALYPLFMQLTRLAGKHVTVRENKEAAPQTSFFDLNVTLINGQPFSLSALKGKKILLVNTASDCGYTAQYEELQTLQDRFLQDLVVIGFPANDFKEQEQKRDEEIAQFCKVSFGVSFPLAKKSIVRKSGAQNEVYRWLTHSDKNGWNNQGPEWNFSKYLVNERGQLTHYFGPSLSPLDAQIVKAVTE